tara:strand:+ start:1086 stop:1895 length:810 start_codon:yes stop_codon:yes gene_type:complete
MEVSEGNNFQEFLLYEYKEKARFEAEEMHDWNSAELYSQKALKSIENNKIYPEETTYWRLPEDKVKEIRNAYKNLITIYDDAMIVDPYNLAIAISSLDCWSEQQEENWQTWDIINCKDSFLNSIHKIYNKISKSEKRIETKEAVSKNKEEAIIVTKNKNDEIIQIVYFDFDKIELSDVSLKNIKKFLINNKKQINEYLIIGHTDTKGTKKYNLSLSIKRAEFVKNILINNGISDKKIDIFGKGEDFLALDTPDETKHPANRRVEIKKSN